MQANRGHPVMGPLKIRSRCQNPFQRGDGFSMLEILRRAPQDPCPGQMSLRQCRVERQGPAAVVFRLLQPSALRVEARSPCSSTHRTAWHVPAQIRDRARRLVDKCSMALRSGFRLIGVTLAQARHEFVITLPGRCCIGRETSAQPAETGFAAIPRPGAQFRPAPRRRCPA